MYKKTSLIFFEKVLDRCEILQEQFGNTFDIGFKFVSTDNFDTIINYSLKSEKEIFNLVKSMLLLSNSSGNFDFFKVFIVYQANRFSQIENFYHIEINDDLKIFLTNMYTDLISGTMK